MCNFDLLNFNDKDIVTFFVICSTNYSPIKKKAKINNKHGEDEFDQKALNTCCLVPRDIYNSLHR